VARGQAVWIRSARADVALALAWIPFALAVEVVHHNGPALQTLLAAVSLFSFVHQPLTLPLVYGDRAQFEARRRVFTLAPFVLIGAIALGWAISLTLVAVVGGLWNMEHTLMQRYGFVRIYGRKTGEDDGRLERLLLLSWLVVTLLSVAADPRTPDRVNALPLGQLNHDALDVLASFRPYASALLAVALVAAAVLSVRWVRLERGRGRAGTANRSKQFYLASTAVMFAWAVLVDPIAGLAGYAGAHAVEYFFIVDHRLSVDRATNARRRFFAVYLTVFVSLYLGVRSYGSPAALTATVLFVGGLHFLYDGFIWKRRSAPATAQPILANVSA
jgi:hypothetical protein